MKLSYTWVSTVLKKEYKILYKTANTLTKYKKTSWYPVIFWTWSNGMQGHKNAKKKKILVRIW